MLARQIHNDTIEQAVEDMVRAMSDVTSELGLEAQPGEWVEPLCELFPLRRSDIHTMAYKAYQSL